MSIIEENEEKCIRLADELDVLVIHGDGASIQDLADAGADRADVLAAVTGQDQDNLVSCQLAKKKFGVRRTIARVNNPKNERVLQQLGVDAAVSSTSLIARLIERELATTAMEALLTFTQSDLTMAEFSLTPDSPAVNKAVKDLVLPEDCLFVSIVRGGKTIFPRGTVVLEPHDMVLAITSLASKPEIERVLVGGKST